MLLWILIGAVLIVSGTINLLLMKRNSQKPGITGELPSKSQVRTSVVMSVATIFIGIYFIIKNLFFG